MRRTVIDLQETVYKAVICDFYVAKKAGVTTQA